MAIFSGTEAPSEAWWDSFMDKLQLFLDKRNKCCHPQLFKWHDLSQLIDYEFSEDEKEAPRDPKIKGVFFACEKGKALERLMGE